MNNKAPNFSEICETVRGTFKMFGYDNPDKMLSEMTMKQIMDIYIKIVKIVLKKEKK